jgi:ABC-type transport system involved in multi-copper enzyme maturation permease subunit
MTFLPIVERELRVAARKRSTYWLRTVAGLIALVIGSACLTLASIGGLGMSGPGGMVFGAIMWLFICTALGAGLFFTSDSLSEEKREGTLGFLFLTDLRGYDVVAGKMLATTLRGFFPLLAFFPIVATTLLMGGVTGTEFWKTSLALLNALFFSLAAGLFVSAISRDSQRALAATLFLMLFFVFGGPLADAAIARIAGRGFQPILSLSSPGYVFRAAGGWGRTFFWQGLLTTQIVAWVLFSFACLLIPHTWQQRAGTTGVATKTWVYNWRYGKTPRRIKLRNKLLPINPVLWLASRERWQLGGMWVLALLAVGVVTWLALDIPTQGWMVLSYPVLFFIFLLYLGAASQSSRFFVEARRSGLIELMLATPLSERKIVLGQWRALLRTFAIPVSIVLVLQLICSGLSHVTMRRTMAAATASAAAASASMKTNTSSGGTVAVSTTNVAPRFTPPSLKSITTQEWLTLIVNSVAAVITSTGNLVALCWFGMWMGMTSKNANLAALKTFLFVELVPYIVLAFGSTMAIGLLIAPYLARTQTASPTFFMVWYPFISTLLMAILVLVKNIVFFIWSRKVLYTSFREQAVRSLSPVVAIPPTIPVPPVIPSPAT